MKTTSWIRKLFGPKPANKAKRGVRDLGDYAESITIEQPSMPGGMSVRPDTAESYVEQEFGHYAEEQYDKHDADGIHEATSAHEQAASLELRADKAKRRAEENAPRLKAMQEQHDHAWHWLLPFVHRAPGAHGLYLTWFLLLMLGDTAGVFGAALMWGELWPVALAQALSSGAAAVAAGWSGADVRERRDAKARAHVASTTDLPGDLSRYPSLFAPVPEERDTYGVLLAVAAMVVVFLATAIFALRAAVEVSLLAGFIFGGLAAATALGSFVNSWRHADQISDLLERFTEKYEVTVEEHTQLILDPAPAQRDGAATRATLIEAYHQKLGVAAKHGVLALSVGILRRNPQIFGHGVVANRPRPVPIGRKMPDLEDHPPHLTSVDRRDERNGFRPLKADDPWHSDGSPPP